MNDNLLKKLETAVVRLTNLNHDNCQDDNQVGWNMKDAAKGASLAKQIGEWTPGQVGLAWAICSRYRNTQLKDLDIPVYSDEARDKYVAQSMDVQYAATVQTCNEANGFNLKWSTPREISTRNGPRIVTNAVLAHGDEFWSVWRKDKERLKAADYSVQEKDGKWTVTKWSTPSAVPAPKPVAQVQLPIADQLCVDPAGLLPYQVASANNLLNSLVKYRSALDASDVGTGKTYTALAVLKRLKLRPLIVCPKAVMPSWRKAALHFGIEIDVINYESVRLGKSGFGGWHVDRKVFQWSDSIEALVFDEVHRCKSMKSQNCKLVVAAKKQSIHTIALSATAATNPTEMKAVGYLLGLFRTPSDHYPWCQQHGCVINRFNGLEYRGGIKVMQALHAQIFPAKGTRISVADLGDAFPETQIGVELLELNGSTAKINEAYEAAEAAIRAVEQKRATDSSSHLTAILRARQISELGKIAAIQDKIEDAIEQGMSVFVCLNFRESIIALREAIQSSTQIGTVPVVWGSQTAVERQAAIDAFQADLARVLIAQINSGGVGISLHDLNGKYPRLALISPTWSALDLRQALGRVHRAGGRSKSIQRVLYAAGTIEEQVAGALESKLNRLDMLNDGDLSEVKIGINSHLNVPENQALTR